jgi:hypothetical protein
MESTLRISAPSVCATRKASALLPEAVGPRITMTGDESAMTATAAKSAASPEKQPKTGRS